MKLVVAFVISVLSLLIDVTDSFWGGLPLKKLGFKYPGFESLPNFKPNQILINVISLPRIIGDRTRGVLQKWEPILYSDMTV